MRLLRDCALILLVAGGLYHWKHRPVPAPAPAYRGARPDLRMPAPTESPAAEAIDSAQYVVHEDAGKKRTPGKPPPPENAPPVGDKPAPILGAPAVDITAEGGPSGALDDERSPWEDRLRKPWAIGAVAALFFVLYSIGARALGKAPGNRD